MNDIPQLQARFKVVKLVGVSIIFVTILLSAVTHGQLHVVFRGLLIGQFGGAYVVYSLIRQGRLKDGVQGPALFAAGVVGMFMRWLVLGVVMYVAYRVHANVVATLVGYLSGFIIIVLGLTGYFRKPAE